MRPMAMEPLITILKCTRNGSLRSVWFIVAVWCRAVRRKWIYAILVDIHFELDCRILFYTEIDKWQLILYSLLKTIHSS